MKTLGSRELCVVLEVRYVESIDSVWILTGQFHRTTKLLSDMDLVVLVNLFGHLLVHEDYLLYVLQNQVIETRSDAYQAAYWCRYKLPYTKVAEWIHDKLDIDGDKLPVKCPYHIYRHKVLKMLCSDRRYNTATLLNFEYWPHFARCRCHRCLNPKVVWDARNTSEFNPSLYPLNVHQYPNHDDCVRCHGNMKY